MYRELQASALIDNFKDKLKSMNFVEESKRPEIEVKLTIVGNPSEYRYKVVEAAKWLWKVFIESSLRDITDNVRGLRELCEYFDDYADYENVLFALDDNHRDHVIHSIWVMLIGFYLRVNYKALKVAGYGMVDILGDTEEEEKSKKDMVEGIKKHEDSLWCLIALTHDLGYPIEKTKKANQKMGKMIRHFGFLEKTDFSYNFSMIHQTAIESLMNILSSVVICLPGGVYNTVSYKGIRLDFAKSLERLDHGIMSAYLLQKYLDYICDCQRYMGELSPPWGSTSRGRAESMAMMLELMYVIASHTSINVYARSLGESSVFLLLCDELDEFSRYSRSDVSGDWTRMMCRTEFECTSKALRFKYTFDRPEIGDRIEEFFYAKVKNIHQRFELSKNMIERLSLVCEDVRKAAPVKWEFNKSWNKYKEGVIIGPEGNIMEIPEELYIN